MSDVHYIMPMWLTTIFIDIPMFSSVAIKPLNFINFVYLKGKCTEGSPVANGGYLWHHQLSSTCINRCLQAIL